MRWQGKSVQHKGDHVRHGKIRLALNNATEPSFRYILKRPVFMRLMLIRVLILIHSELSRSPTLRKASIGVL